MNRNNSGGIPAAPLQQLQHEIQHADAIVIGAGAGFSASAGLTYTGKRFEENFAPFIQAYSLRDMYSAGFYPYESPEAFWAYWSLHIYHNRYARPVGQPYLDLLKLVSDKPYFVLTTNVDHLFQDAGFQQESLFYTQGDYGRWQCSVPCHNQTYDNREQVLRMVAEQKNLRIPSELIPYCPHCGKPMSMQLRCDDTFVQDEGWYAAQVRYAQFITSHENDRILFLELGVGFNTPSIIKYPFWRMTERLSKARYACINLGEAECPQQLAMRAICIDGDIGDVLSLLVK